MKKKSYLSSAELTGRYCGVTGTRDDMAPLQTINVRSMLECSVQCNLNKQCLGFSFSNGNKECRLLHGAQSVNKKIDQHWIFFTKCLKDKTVCLSCVL